VVFVSFVVRNPGSRYGPVRRSQGPRRVCCADFFSVRLGRAPRSISVQHASFVLRGSFSVQDSILAWRLETGMGRAYDGIETADLGSENAGVPPLLFQ